eukprot:gene6591-12131_t
MSGQQQSTCVKVSKDQVDDERLVWMTDVFLEYLKRWKENIEKRPGEYSKEERAKMFISKQTYGGFIINIKSTVEIIKFLLNNGFQYVLTERLMQDVLEEYFGYQRSHGRPSKNPSANEFGFNDQIINMQ